jgi:hypothetical protein
MVMWFMVRFSVGTKKKPADRIGPDGGRWRSRPGLAGGKSLCVCWVVVLFSLSRRADYDFFVLAMWRQLAAAAQVLVNRAPRGLVPEALWA